MSGSRSRRGTPAQALSSLAMHKRGATRFTQNCRSTAMSPPSVLPNSLRWPKRPASPWPPCATRRPWRWRPPSMASPSIPEWQASGGGDAQQGRAGGGILRPHHLVTQFFYALVDRLTSRDGPRRPSSPLRGLWPFTGTGRRLETRLPATSEEHAIPLGPDLGIAQQSVLTPGSDLKLEPELTAREARCGSRPGEAARNAAGSVGGTALPNRA